MHRIVRQPAQAEPAKPSGEKGYIVLRKYDRGWYVTLSPFKEVPVYSDVQTAIVNAQDGEFILSIDLPEIEG